MGLLRIRSKANLKAKEQERTPVTPPQLPPLPDHIRRTAGAALPQLPPQQQQPQAGRRRSRSLWAASDEAQAARAAAVATPVGGRRGSFSSTCSDAQPWRSREAWLALHTAPEPPSVLSALTFPCAQDELPPGWRGRGGGGFFGNEAANTESSELVRRADAELRGDVKRDAPYSPRRAAGGVPGSPRSARRVLAASPPPHAKPAGSRVIDFGASPLTTPRAAVGPAPTARPPPPSAPSRSASDASSGSAKPPSFASSASSAQSSSGAVPVTPRQRRGTQDADLTPPEALAGGESPATPSLLMTPNASTLPDASSPWGAQMHHPQRAASPLHRNDSASTSASVATANSFVSAVPTPSRPARRAPPVTYTQSDDGHGRGGAVERVAMDHRSSLPTARAAGDVIVEAGANEVIDFSRPAAAPAVALAPQHQPPAVQQQPQQKRMIAPTTMATSKLPQPVRSGSGSQRSSSALGFVQNAAGFIQPPGAAMAAAGATLQSPPTSHPALLPTGSRPPSRNASNSSHRSQRPPSRQAVERPGSRQADSAIRPSSRQAVEHPSGQSSRQTSDSQRQAFMDRIDRPPSRGASSTGHSTTYHSDASHRPPPHTPAGIADAVSMWRAKSKREVHDEPYMPGPGSRPRTPSNASHSNLHHPALSSRRPSNRSFSGSQSGHGSVSGHVMSSSNLGHGGSNHGHGGGSDHGHGIIETGSTYTTTSTRKQLPHDWEAEELDTDPFAPHSHHIHAPSGQQHDWEAAYDSYADDDFRPPTRLPALGMGMPHGGHGGHPGMPDMQQLAQQHQANTQAYAKLRAHQQQGPNGHQQQQQQQYVSMHQQHQVHGGQHGRGGHPQHRGGHPQQHHAHGHHGHPQQQHGQQQRYQPQHAKQGVPVGVPGGLMHVSSGGAPPQQHQGGAQVGKTPLQITQMQMRQAPRVEQAVAQGGWI